MPLVAWPPCVAAPASTTFHPCWLTAGWGGLFLLCRAYEPRFGTEDNPIQVPALLDERIIGVTDPDDDTLVIWGVIRQGEPPKQLVAGGEFFVLKKVERVEKVGDKLGIPLMPTVDH